jgi:hypothetical protein
MENTGIHQRSLSGRVLRLNSAAIRSALRLTLNVETSERDSARLAELGGPSEAVLRVERRLPISRQLSGFVPSEDFQRHLAVGEVILLWQNPNAAKDGTLERFILEAISRERDVKARARLQSDTEQRLQTTLENMSKESRNLRWFIRRAERLRKYQRATITALLGDTIEAGMAIEQLNEIHGKHLSRAISLVGCNPPQR